MVDRPRVILCSSDSFGAPALEALTLRGWLTGLVTQPDRPRGRGRHLEPLPIRTRAEALGIATFTPEKIGSPESVAGLDTLQPDYLVIASFAQYLPKVVRDIPRQACLNIHPSLLPQYRGSAPIQAALWAGDTQTGVVIHYTEKGIDTGAVLAQREVPIAADTTAGELREQLAHLGAELLIEVITAIDSGTAVATEQDHAAATLTRLLTPEDRHLDYLLPAPALVNRIRALTPLPGALLGWPETPLGVGSARTVESEPADPGTLRAIGKNSVALACQKSWLELLTVQPAGKKMMPVPAWLNGLRGPLPVSLPRLVADPRPLVGGAPHD